jgi:xanthine permease XanP
MATPTARKPVNIVYGVDEVPPFGVTVLSGFQHVGLISIFLVYPLLVSRDGGLSVAQISDSLSLTMLILGIGAILQSMPRGPVGARYLCPPVCTAAYLEPSLLAVKMGGMALVFGMTAFGGAVEALFSRFLRPLRPYFPPEISGFVVMLIGISIGILGLRYLLGVGAAKPVDSAQVVVAAVTLTTMVGLSVWTRGAARVFCALIGMALGYVAAGLMGLLTEADIDAVARAPLVYLPSAAGYSWSWDSGLVIPFLVAALATGVRAIGDITICQKVNDADWVRPNMQSVSGGVLANGLTNVLAGLFGAHAVSTYTSSIGLAAASGVTSRRIGYAIGGILVLLAFLPKASAVLLIMPRPIIGAALLFTAAIIFVNGLQIIASRLLDARRTFVIGLSFIAGIAVDLFPGQFAAAPGSVQPFLTSSLVLGTILALALNAVFRLGMGRAHRIVVDPVQVESGKIEEFMEASGGAWGARRDVIDRARFSLIQSVETIVEGCAPEGPVEIVASFDEFNLDVRVSYFGPPLELPDKRPSNEEIMASEEGQRRLAGFMLRRYADRVQASHRAGRSTIQFHFDH